MRIALSLRKLGLTSDVLHGLGFGSMAAAISLWGRSASVGDWREKARAERLAIFIGLWPPTFFLLGKSCKTLKPPPLSKFCGHEALKSRSSTKHSATRPQQYQRPDVALEERAAPRKPLF
jgi:hypothetical protein